MPSNFTENYQLSQWERTDQVQMEDFNADNLKIDAALKGIGQIHIFERWDHISGYFNVADINWKDWTLVGGTLYVPKNDNTSSFIAVSAYNASGAVTSRCSDMNNSFGHLGHRGSIFILTPFRDPDRGVNAFYLGTRCGVGYADCKFSELKKLSFGAGGSYPDGCRATFWGVK